MSNEMISSAKNILASIENIKTADSQLELLKKINTQTSDQKKQIDELKIKRKEFLNRIENELSNLYKAVNQPVQAVPNIPQPQMQKPKPAITKIQMPLAKQKKINDIGEVPAPLTIQPLKKTIEIQKMPLEAPSPVQTVIPLKFDSNKFKNLNKEQKKRFMKDLNIKKEELKDFIKLQKAKNKTKIVLVKEDYSIYHPSKLGKITNKYMKKYADSLVRKYPRFFEPMFRHFRMVEVELLSRTYVSMMLFFTILSFPMIFLFFLALNFAFNLSIIKILLIAFAGTILTFIGFYFYPASLIGSKDKKIKLELPFALVHMSAVAGSGANPMSIFELIAESEEYPELKKEVKKIMNYVNLFGYNLTNALKNVAATTPNPELKELLNGMISTIETGGDLRGYLRGKSEDALNTYRLDRRKQVEALSTYSEIYTAILIAAPLLLLVTLAIMNSIGGNIGGLSVTTIAWIGIVGVLPLLNIGYMLFISFSQKGI